MWDKPSINKLPGERLHLRHGPITIVLKVWASGDVVRQAHRLVTRHFPKILPELAGELLALRQPISKKSAKFQGKTAQRMADAALPFADVYVTPMAAVAGAVAEEVLRIIQAAGPIEKAFVNDGGDIAFHLEPGRSLNFGVAGDFSEGPTPAINGTIALSAEMGLGGIATSGANGRSFSLGIADSITVLAKTAAAADVAATLIGNAVNIDSKVITRKQANKLDPDTDLGELLVTTKVGKLSPDERTAALDAGMKQAEAYLANGLIAGAVLMLQGDVRAVGGPVAALKSL
jgi:uncharacterized protein